MDSPAASFRESSIQVLVALEDSCSIGGQPLARLDSVFVPSPEEQQFSGRFVLATLARH
ncbi:hypothetical protein AAHB37_04860 [Glutamicibacter halophytocola]|uniref:hypothetical protein n=1 Tax=Glutamicibacter halophytocola TaxID=1933880 RepID=UPI0032197077